MAGKFCFTVNGYLSIFARFVIRPEALDSRQKVALAVAHEWFFTYQRPEVRVRLEILFYSK